MRLGLTYNLQTDPTDPRQAECDPPRVVDAVRQALSTLGHEVTRLGSAEELLQMPERLHGIELVFNLAEGTHGRCREAWVPTVLERLKVPYVGSDPLALMLGLDKLACKRLAVSTSVPTPQWIMVNPGESVPSTIPLTFPMIVKPRYEGSGRAIDSGAVVYDHAALAQRVGWSINECQQPALVEQFIPFGELTVCLIGNNPVQAYPAIQRPLDPSTRLACHVVRSIPSDMIAPLDLTDELDARARQIATTMFDVLGCHDMARVDLRVDQDGQLYFLEINPLPSFDPDGSFGLLAEYLGLRYADLIGCVVDATIRRHQSTSAVVPALRR